MLKEKKYTVIYSVVCAFLLIFIGANTAKYAQNGSFYVYSYVMSCILSVFIWAAGVFSFEFSDKIRKWMSVIFLLIVPLFDMEISMIFAGTPEFSISIYFINVLFYLCIGCAVYAVSTSGKISGIVSVAAAYLFNLTSFTIKIMRGTPLVPADILAVGTAAQVAGSYSFHITYEFIMATVIALFMIALLVNFDWYKWTEKRTRIISSIISAVLSVVIIVSLFSIDVESLNIDMFDQIHTNNTHGVAYGFFINWRKMKLTKPEGYSTEYVKEKLLSGRDEREPSEDKPNIIVIMNESFSEMGVNGELITDIGYLDNFYSLDKNTIRGQMLVTPYGGGTCNTEYEFLTGMSMGSLPPGSLPYLQYIQREYDGSLVRHLKSMGYKTAAFHPYVGSDWNRDKVYGFLGFDSYISQENMGEYLDGKELRYVRNFLSDETDYDILLNMLEDKDDDERMFIFNVTIQNHGGYDFDDSEEQYAKVHITNMKGNYPEAEQYLSLMKESDRVFGEFIEKIQSVEEKTIVVMFGDHQPGLEESFYSELCGISPDNMTMEELQKRYIVPFAIWANYDIESRSGVFTSPPYLSNYILDAAELPYSSVNMFLAEEKKEIPAINDMGHYDSEGIWQTNDPDEDEFLRDYGYLQYYMLKENQNNS